MRLMGSKSLVIETLDSNASEGVRLEAELSAIRRRLNRRRPQFQIHKFTFINEPVPTVADLLTQPDQSFLGYAIIVNIDLGNHTYWSYIFEAVTKETSWVTPQGLTIPYPNHYLHVRNTFTGMVSENKSYRINGSYFCQQNCITSVCAHACAAMALTNSPVASRIVTPEDINQILGYDHISKKLPINYALVFNDSSRFPNRSPGLKWEHLRTVFNYHEYEDDVIEYQGSPTFFRSFLYSYLESGFPSILCFAPRFEAEPELHHVVAVVGHTMNPHSWLPLAFSRAARQWAAASQHSLGQSSEQERFQAISSLKWVDDLIIHDDNFGMQMCLPGHAFKPTSNPDHYLNFTPHSGMGIFPKAYQIKLSGYFAELIASGAFRENPSLPQLLRESYYGERFLSPFQRNTLRHDLVFRTQLVKWLDYLETQGGIDCLSGEARAFAERIQGRIPFVWLVEVTEPDLLIGNYAKVVDILLDPTFEISKDGTKVQQNELRRAIFMYRLPGGTIVPDAGHPIWRPLPGWPFLGDQHQPLFRRQNNVPDLKL